MTNLYNVDEIFLKAIDKEKKEKDPNRFSVTELLKPTYQVKLMRENNIEEDVNDKIIALLGTAFHKYMEQFSHNPEVKLEVEEDGNTLVGVIDDINEKEFEIIDYKTVNTKKVIKKDFEDHEMQIKAYAYMARKKGILVTKGKLHYLMKDWQKIQTTRSNDYPLSPLYTHVIDITEDDIKEAGEYIKNKIKEIKDPFNIKMCTEEERWYTGDEYAVYKKAGDKKASKVCKTEEEAHQYISEKCDGAGEIQIRKGTYLRCDLYCPVRSFCERYKGS